MTHTRKNQGTCSTSTTVTLENGVIQKISVPDACDGNMKAICALLPGKGAQETIELLQDIRCDEKSTSCPAQIAACLAEALAHTNT